MLQEQNTSVLRSPGEAGMCLALPELGAIPRGVEEQRSSHLSESYRATVVSILSATHNGGHPRNLVFTSSRPMEGKTTLVSSLGLALAEIGKQVLLIDGDMRRPQLHRVFDQVNGWGLSDVLREWHSIEELPFKVLVKKTTVPNLYLLPGGGSADDISGLLYSGRLTELLARSREESTMCWWMRRPAWSVLMPGIWPDAPTGWCSWCERVAPSEKRLGRRTTARVRWRSRDGRHPQWLGLVTQRSVGNPVL